MPFALTRGMALCLALPLAGVIAFRLPWIVVAAAVAAVAVLVVVVLARLLRRRPADEADRPADLRIDLATLPAAGPPKDGPQLEFYNLPVRLAVLVLAPAGRGSRIPPKDLLPEIVERLLPGLMRVLSSHRPIFHRWPPQLSSQGFAQTFFACVPLPGDRGRGTPWSSAAGRVEAFGRSYLVGMVFRAAEPNSLSQTVVQHTSGWLDVLRVRNQ